MKRYLSLATAFFLWVCPLAPGFAADGGTETAAVIKSLSGPVSVIRQGNTLTGVEGFRLLQNDEVRTGQGGSVGVGFSDGTRISLGAESSCVVNGFCFQPAEKKFAFDVYMKKGSMAYASGKIGKLDPGSVRIATPQGTVGIRGTKLLIKVD